MKTLLIDNYDSFTYMLHQYLWEVNGEEPLLFRNDAISVTDLEEIGFDNIVLSPGPGHPGRLRDFGICADILRKRDTVPVLGVCLGHQGIALEAGAAVDRAPLPRHGLLSRIRHDGRGLFRGLPQGFAAVRYHSLHVPEGVMGGAGAGLLGTGPGYRGAGNLGPGNPNPSNFGPSNLEVTARSVEDGVVMGLRRRDRPVHGVQFHPESALTEFGHALLRNFRELTAEFWRERNGAGRERDGMGRRRGGRKRAPARAGRMLRSETMGPEGARVEKAQADKARPEEIRSEVEKTAGGARKRSEESQRSDGRKLYLREWPWQDPEDFFKTHLSQSPYAFWLDGEGAGSPFSHQGEAEGGFGSCGAVFFAEEEGRRRRIDGVSDAASFYRSLLNRSPGEHQYGDAENKETSVSLPFQGGLLGYFGYEMRRFCGSPVRDSRSEGLPPLSGLPESFFFRVDRFFTWDHERKRLFARCRESDDMAGRERAERWLSHPFPKRTLREKGAGNPEGTLTGGPGSADYQAQVLALKEEIAAGEIYQACLTQEIEAEMPAGFSAEAFHLRLRKRNPAPYSAYLRFGSFSLVSASPELFLRLEKDGRLLTRPIKGTLARGARPEDDAANRKALAQSEKDKAENLMIADLLRNDFGRICRKGTVRASRLFEVEDHPTVFQLVSTVEGRLKAGLDALDAWQACFPGGSMTGAPKLRAMEILEAAERRRRGAFSGCLGYLGDDGSMEMSIVIRTAVCERRDGGSKVSIGCGGAVTALSDPEAEWREARLKAKALLLALELAPEEADGERRG